MENTPLISITELLLSKKKLTQPNDASEDVVYEKMVSKLQGHIALTPSPKPISKIIDYSKI